MAIECTYVDEDTGFSITNAYAKVRHISGDAVIMYYTVDVWADKEKSDSRKEPKFTEEGQLAKLYEPVKTFHGDFVPDLKSKKNFLQQAYDVLKKQGHVKNVKDA